MSNQDKGYAWVILFAAFSIHALKDGIRSTYGLLFVEFLEHFGETRATAAWIGSIMLGVFNLSGLISVLIVKKFGCRLCALLGCVITTLAFILNYFATSIYYLYATYGAMQGFGLGLLHLGATVSTGKYFKKRRALAVGISFSGGGIGAFVFAPLSRKIIDIYSWRGAMFILAGISLNGCIFSLLLRPFVKEKENEVDDVPERKDTEIDNEVNSGKGNNQRNDICSVYQIETSELMETDSTREVTSTNDLQMVKNESNPGNSTFKNPFIESIFPKAMLTNINFIILQLATIFIALPEFVPFSMLPDFALTVNCTSSQSAWMISALGIGSCVSQGFGGWLSDMKCVSPVILLGMCILSIGVTTMIVAVVPMLETLLVYAVMFGSFSGVMYALQLVVLFEYVGEEYMAATMGVLMFVFGVCDFVGTPIAGWIFDQTGSYTISFLVAGASFVISAAVTFPVYCRKSVKHTNTSVK